MNNTIEIELRYKVLNIEKIHNFLSTATQLHTKHDVDIYFDMPDRLLWKRGIFIRIRNDKKLDIKFNRECLHDLTIDRLDYCEEHSFILPLQETDLQKLNDMLINLDLKPMTRADLSELKTTNNLDAHYIVDKERTSYEYHGFTIAVDEVAGLGHFLEIELMTQDTDKLENVKTDMRSALADLPLQPTRIGYGALLLKQNEFDCYIQGRYALKEDKRNYVKQKISNVLLLINDRLKSHDINWMIYGAIGLILHGLDFEMHDVDILTDQAGLHAITDTLAEFLKETTHTDISNCCAVKVSTSTFMINGISVECKSSPTHSPLLQHICYVNVADQAIPVISLDGQLKAYQMCSRPKDLPKVNAIKQHKAEFCTENNEKCQ